MGRFYHLHRLASRTILPEQEPKRWSHKMRRRTSRADSMVTGRETVVPQQSDGQGRQRRQGLNPSSRSVQFGVRKAPTRIKHGILREYVGAWAGIISRGLVGQERRGGYSVKPDFVFLDGYAGFGRYAGDADDPTSGPVWGSPIIGMAALAVAAEQARSDGLESRISGIFIDEDSDKCAALLVNCSESEVDVTVNEVSAYSLSCLGSGVVINGDFREHVTSIINALPSSAFLLAFVDPYGPSASFNAIKSLLSRPKTDAIIFFPSHDVFVRGASATKPEPDLSSSERGNLTRNDALFGNDTWRRIAHNSSLSKEEKVDRYVDLYQSRLDSLARRLFIKEIGLRFSDIDTPAYHLFLVTDNPDGAMRMNDILWKAEFRRHVERWRDMETRVRQRKEEQGVLELDLGLSHTKKPDVELEQSPEEEVRHTITEVLRGVEGNLTWGELKGYLADEIYRQTEIRRALTALKRQRRISYKRLRSNSTVIEIRGPL